MIPRQSATGRVSRLAARVRSATLAGRTAERPAPLAEVAVLVLVLLVFTRLHSAAGQGVADAATANAAALRSIERALHLDVTLAVNRWLVEHPAVIKPAVYYYRLYYIVIVGVLVWVFVRHPGDYVRVRRVLVVMALLALPVFWALPMSPPRFAVPGVVDIVAEHDILGGEASHTITAGRNLYSAMPSMHTAWSLWCGYAAWYALRARHPRLAPLPWLFPLGMAAVVLATGNHYLLDVAGSVTLLLVSIAVASAWDRLAARRRARRRPPSTAT
jgi:PAP2 superfamily.